MKHHSKIEKRLSDYLDFDVSQIINEKIDYAYIFGGAIRDIIADKDIHDIDILCLPESMRFVSLILGNNGYKYQSDLAIKNVYSMYKDIHCIFEPHIWMNKNRKIVQLIKPRPENINEIYGSFFNLLRNVDISCCGVNYSFIKGLQESVDSAILHCKHHVFEERRDAIMFHDDRLRDRVYKLEQRGWTNLSGFQTKKVERKKLELNRVKKLKRIV